MQLIDVLYPLSIIYVSVVAIGFAAFILDLLSPGTIEISLKKLINRT